VSRFWVAKDILLLFAVNKAGFAKASEIGEHSGKSTRKIITSKIQLTNLEFQEFGKS
jgi:hypothetical protein